MVSVPAEQVVAELVAELANARLTVPELLDEALATLSRFREGTWVGLVMNPDPSTSHVVSADDSNPRMAAYVERYMASLARPRTVPTVGMSRSVIDSGRPILVSFVSLERLFDLTTPAAREWYERHPLPMPITGASTAVVPMRAQGHALGTLQLLEWNPPQPLTDTDVRWLQVVADRLGLLVEHVQCQETSIVRLDRLNAIRNVAMALASSQDLRLTLHVILEQLAGRLQVDAADVLVVDEAAGDLYVAAGVGFHSGAAPDSRLPIPPELTDPASPGRRFDSRTDPDWYSRFRRQSQFAREGFQSYRAASLRMRGKLVGVLEVLHRSPLEVDEEWVTFLDAMGTSAAIAIENAVLHEQLERGTAAPRPSAPKPDLSAMEWRILGLVADGSTNREIAAAVHLSENTIKFYLRRLLDRLGAVNRTDLARKATRQGWL